MQMHDIGIYKCSFAGGDHIAFIIGRKPELPLYDCEKFYVFMPMPGNYAIPVVLQLRIKDSMREGFLFLWYILFQIFV